MKRCLQLILKHKPTGERKKEKVKIKKVKILYSNAENEVDLGRYKLVRISLLMKKY